MDANLFVNPDMGTIVEIGGGKGGVAFVPADLPRELALDLDVWELLAEAAARIGQLAGEMRGGGGGLRIESRALIRPLRMREAVRSSQTEGIDVVGDDLLLLDLAERGEEKGTNRHDPAREAVNLVDVLDASDAYASRGFTVDLVKDLHRRLMTDVRGQDKRPGEMRIMQVVIGSDHRFVPPPADRVYDLLQQWSAWAEDDSIRIHPVVRAAMLHYQFETIHPFLDGNGRVGRLLWSMMLSRWTPLGEAGWLYVSPFVEQHRREYADAMFDVSAKGDWGQWLRFALRAVAHEALDSHDRVAALIDLWKRWREIVEEQGLKVRTLSLLESLLSRPVVDIRTAAKVMDSAYNTARTDLERLVGFGVLREIEGRTPTTYIAPDVRRITLDDQWRTG